MAVLRPEHDALREYLSGWDLQIAFEGALRPWTGGPVGPPENAIWARPSAEDPWQIDFKIEAVDGDLWLYRRDPTIRVPIAELGIAIEGIPFLAPAVARLYRDRPTLSWPQLVRAETCRVTLGRANEGKRKWRTSSASSTTIR